MIKAAVKVAQRRCGSGFSRDGRRRGHGSGVGHGPASRPQAAQLRRDGWGIAGRAVGTPR